MAKLKKDEEVQQGQSAPEPEEAPLPEELEPEPGTGDELEGLPDFNVEDEYKPDPLIPNGTYHGVVTKVTYKSDQFCLLWDCCLHDNGGVMNDGETPIDGAHVYYRNWMPKPGDEKVMTKAGRSTKWQSKINMLKAFEDEVGVDMTTPQRIATALSEQHWIGLEIDLDIGIDQYLGRFRNVANRMRANRSGSSESSFVDEDTPF